MKGMFFNIQKFATHNAPGIRTVVFLIECLLAGLNVTSKQVVLVDGIEETKEHVRSFPDTNDKLLE